MTMALPVAMITGAGSGIGQATAELLAAAGYRLVLFDRDEKAVSDTCRVLPADAQAIAVTGDVSCEEDVRAMVRQVTERFGRLDAVVANAGINGVWAPIEDLKPSEWDEAIGINLRGTYLTLHNAVPLLKSAGGGAIVIVSSINGVRTFTNPGATAYSASKAAQVAMAKQLALELGKYRIRVNAVCPGAIDTNIVASSEIRNREAAEVPVIWPQGSIPLTDGEPGRATDVAKVIRFLLSTDASHITGSPVFVDGGQGLLR
jgi:NAD(P)-dependent dehydrogenase (short-subunit alcohol dehydrogenase family)